MSESRTTDAPAPSPAQLTRSRDLSARNALLYLHHVRTEHMHAVEALRGADPSQSPATTHAHLVASVTHHAALVVRAGAALQGALDAMPDGEREGWERKHLGVVEVLPDGLGGEYASARPGAARVEAEAGLGGKAVGFGG